MQSPAVRVFDGDVDSVTVLSSQLTGSADVVDAHNVPRGAWAARSGGGFTIVGTANESAVGNAILTASGGATHRGDYVGRVGITRGHALLLGESGDVRRASPLRRAAPSAKSHSFDTTLHRVTTNSTTLDLPPIKPEAWHCIYSRARRRDGRHGAGDADEPWRRPHLLSPRRVGFSCSSRMKGRKPSIWRCCVRR